MMSIANIAGIKKPVVWTLHDMWAFCGAEHYSEDDRWREGYHRGNRRQGEVGFDLNRWVWRRKRHHWQRPMHIVTPSRWLGDCVRASALMRDWPQIVVPNCLDLNQWKPTPRTIARELLGFAKGVPLLMSLGTGGTYLRKGFDLLISALGYLRKDIPDLELVVLGQNGPHNQDDPGYPIHYMGHLHDDISLRVLYTAVDVMVMPSRQDNLPNMAVEAQACGRPVVAFDVGGFSDIVEHQQSGYLARAFDTEDLATGIRWTLENANRAKLGEHARARAVKHFSSVSVAEQYQAVYAQALDAAQ